MSLFQKMEKDEKINVGIDESLIKTDREHVEEQGEGTDCCRPNGESTLQTVTGTIEDNLPPDEFPKEFQCCVCLELLYKPVVLACGHMSCFWCVYRAMNHVHESNCPICRCPFNHFPSVCEVLHFLLLKLYPIAYKRRERQVQEEEKRAGRFSLQFEQNLVEPEHCENSENLGNNNSLAHLQENLHSESCSKDWESSSLMESSKTIMQNENGIPIEPTSSKHPEVFANAPNQGKSWLKKESEHKDQKGVSVADLLCAACERLLFRPVVLNCGHVYCESCFVTPNDETLRCQVCKSLQPNGFPSVCLILDHFLEEKFPEKYSERQGSRQAQQHANRATSKSTDIFTSWLLGNGPKVHIGVGCDFCGMSPIIGERYKCKDCVEKMGFDLCESCYKDPAKIPGRFNQQHKPEHEFEVVPPISLSDLIRVNSEQSDEDGSDAPEHMEEDSRTPATSSAVQLDQGDGSQEPEDTSPSLILSAEVSLDQEDDSDDPTDNISSDLTLN